jgi:hypothetical protein
MIDESPAFATFVASSRTYASLDRVRGALVAAVQSSRTAAVLQPLGGQWRSLPWRERRAMSGIILLVAAAVAVLLAWWSGTMIGPFWLIVPGVAACIGMVSVMTARWPAR